MIPSLAEFAASMVYLMWHARQPLRHGISSRSAASANPAFKRFVLQVLTATRLTESVVYLAMKFIAILLYSNPTIEGDEGSEYRLLIVALMLSNKFLDDITFTNKTWAEVSGMKLQDLNVMEAEFLDALDYNIFVRDTEYNHWKTVLDRCRERARMTCFESSPEREEFIRVTLVSLGLKEDARKQEERYRREQQEERQKRESQLQKERLAWEVLQQSNYHRRDYGSNTMNLHFSPLNSSHNRHHRIQKQTHLPSPSRFVTPPPPISRHSLPKVPIHHHHHHHHQEEGEQVNNNDGTYYFRRCQEFNPIRANRFHSQPFAATWDPFNTEQDLFSSHPLVQPQNVNTFLSWRNYN
ncbi:hypothetical protein J3Q64DRAFT_1723590 [Phycomyces blakesleeanus]